MRRSPILDKTNGINPDNRGGSIGPPGGSQPDLPGQPGLGSSSKRPHAQTDIGEAEDSFAVFKGGENPLYATPVWTYAARDGLNPQTVSAVAAFKRAVAAADKAAKPRNIRWLESRGGLSAPIAPCRCRSNTRFGTLAPTADDP